MYYQKRATGYSFVYYDFNLRKNVRLKSEITSHIQSEAEAIEFREQWMEKHSRMTNEMKSKMIWVYHFPNFIYLVRTYRIDRKEEAPNSWMNYVSDLKFHVLPYFLNIKKEGDVSKWVNHFEDFREYLKDEPPMRRRKRHQTMSYSSINHIITALNTFLTTLYRRRILDRSDKCRPFSQSRLKERSEESVIDPFFQKEIYARLLSRSKPAAHFFHISLHTGLRLNEQFGLSIDDFFLDLPEANALVMSLRAYQLKPLGFLALTSQPKFDTFLRNRSGRVPRKPLKRKRRTDSRDGRIIPIFDKDTFNFLARLWNEQREFYNKKTHGENPKDYLLFDGLRRNPYCKFLKDVQKSLLSPKIYTPHDSRHTYCTWLAGATAGNYTLCRMILGHTALEVTMKYVHLSAQIQKQLRSNLQFERPLKLVS